MRQPTKKDRKHPGVRVYYIYNSLRLWIGYIETPGEKETVCSMINQHIAADKTPVKISVPNNKLKQEK